tara:strand:+ start:128 stop:754 length:627 start_codon:yes stop_codon:yes gene_type:complete
MDIKNYNSDLHKHIISTWAASTAASQITFRFSVECGMKLILLGANGSFIDELTFTNFIKEIKNFKSQKEYDSWHYSVIENMRKKSDDLQLLLEKHNKNYEDYSYGIAAKLLNCYLKVFFLEYFGKEKFADFIHPPIDRLLLLALQEEDPKLFNFNNDVFVSVKYPKIPVWTKINVNEYTSIINLINEFILSRGQKGLWRSEAFWRGHQ